jgi:putative transposase
MCHRTLVEKDFTMPRRARLAVAGIPWHIIQRGNNRSACFYRENDYLVYLDQLKQQAEEFGCAIHAYCLMTNHVHLLLTPEAADSPSLMMKNLGQHYVQYINRTYSRSGTLWEGRFKSCLAQNDAYALICYAYIELNPVRASIVASPEQYRWSSYSCNGEGYANSLIRPHRNYLSMATTSSERCAVYRKLITSRINDESITQIRQATQGNYVLGDEGFQQEIAHTLGRRVTPGKSGRPWKKD